MLSQRQKHLLRKEALQKRLGEDRTKLQNLSRIIVSKLEKTKEFKSSMNILFYFPIKNEVDILPLIKKYLKKKNILLPKIKSSSRMSAHHITTLKNLTESVYKTLEPDSKDPEIKPTNIELILVPGVAFDVLGNRLGFGKGYYDKFLKKTKCPLISPAYNFQVYKKIPTEIHDHKIDKIITEKKTYNISLK